MGAIGEEAAQALDNVRAIVEAAGGTLANVVQCTIYISGITHWAEVNGIYGAFFAKVPVLPARTVVPVKEMHYGSHIEIQAIAFLQETSDENRVGNRTQGGLRAIETAVDLAGCVQTPDDTDQSSVDQDAWLHRDSARKRISRWWLAQH
jgi:hypothetical protein